MSMIDKIRDARRARAERDARWREHADTGHFRYWRTIAEREWNAGAPTLVLNVAPQNVAAALAAIPVPGGWQVAHVGTYGNTGTVSFLGHHHVGTVNRTQIIFTRPGVAA